MAEIIPFRPQQGGSGQSNTSTESQGEPIEIFDQLRRQAEQGRLNHQAAVSEVTTESRRLKRPSFFIYFTLYYLAVAADIVSFIEKPIEATGVGEILIFTINLVISVFFFLISRWLGRKIKNIRLSGEHAALIAEQVAQRISTYRQQLALVIQTTRKSHLGRRFLASQTGRKLIKTSAKLARATRSPATRSIITGIAELIPILDLVPWYTINIYLTHRDHKREHEAAQNNLAAANKPLLLESGELNGLNNTLHEIRNVIEEDVRKQKKAT